MTLPHQAPLLFAKEVVQKSSSCVDVLCEFPYPPSLPMLLEAAAQGSAALGEDVVHVGMLVGVHDVILLQKPSQTQLIISLHEVIRMGEMRIVEFAILNVVQGKVTMYVS